jgi:tetratricopeptide (TPR) repeat protein
MAARPVLLPPGACQAPAGPCQPLGLAFRCRHRWFGRTAALDWRHMIWRLGVTVGAALVAAIGVGGMIWPNPRFEPLESDTSVPALPVPPIPPRISQGEEYERCLDALTDDPAQTLAAAKAWQARGGGDGAEHCRALAEIVGGRADEGAARLERLGESSRLTDAARAIVYGQAVQARLIAGAPDRALEDATRALDLAPASVDLLIQRATAAAAAGRSREAAADLSRALDLEPGRTDALILRAAAWRQQGRIGAAMADAESAVTLVPENVEALLERGILRQRTGNLSGARADWEAVRRLDPDSPAADLAEQNLALLDAGSAGP